jgi:hypothetical protein
MNDATLSLPGLSPVCDKRVEVRFDGGLLSSDGGVLALREIEKRLGVADRLALVSLIRATLLKSRIAWPTSSAFDC